MIRDIHTLCKKFKDAEHSIQLLIVQVSSIGTASTHISSWLEATLETHAKGANEDLLMQLGTSLDACDSLMKPIHAYVEKVSGGAKRKTSWKVKMRHSWDEGLVKDYRSMLQVQVQALSLLLPARKL